MKILMMTDLEGVSGVVSFVDQGYADGRYHERAKKLLTAEVNAVVDGLLAAGATDVLVIDGHGPGGMCFEDLHPRARMLHGKWPPWTQMAGFFGEFDAYSRTFLSSRSDYEGATPDEDFERVSETVDPWAAGFELGELSSTFLLTDNDVTTTAVGVTLDFQLMLTLRHGVYEVQGVDTPAMIILTWLPQRAEGEDGTNSMEQSYSIELDIQRPGGSTLRLMASWIQVEGIFDHDSDVVKVTGVNKNLDSSRRLVDICAGDVVLYPE